MRTDSDIISGWPSSTLARHWNVVGQGMPRMRHLHDLSYLSHKVIRHPTLPTLCREPTSQRRMGHPEGTRDPRLSEPCASCAICFAQLRV